MVKRIWTPSFTLWSGGICFVLLAFFYEVIDVRGHRRWAFPLVIVGMNSIAAYVMDHLLTEFVQHELATHLGPGFFFVLGYAYAPLLQGVAALAFLWLILFWMWKRGLFLRI